MVRLMMLVACRVEAHYINCLTDDVPLEGVIITLTISITKPLYENIHYQIIDEHNIYIIKPINYQTNIFNIFIISYSNIFIVTIQNTF